MDRSARMDSVLGFLSARRRMNRHSPVFARCATMLLANTGRDHSGSLMESRYLPIEQYGIIGNMRSAALVGMDGSLDWLCLPRFDSPSVFAALLDDRKGGCFRIAPASDGFRHKQFYWPDTNVLIPRFLHDAG